MSKEKDVKVIDRRHFTEEGELKEDTPVFSSEEDRENGSKSTPTPEPEPEKTPQSEKVNDLPPPVDFQSFIVSLYTSAAVQMGLLKIPDEDVKVDLIAAKQTIDVLNMLKMKTHGNRTAEEDKLLEELLAQLQMSFVKLWEAK